MDELDERASNPPYLVNTHVMRHTNLWREEFLTSEFLALLVTFRGGTDVAA